jgi:hypothetical protein
LCCTVISQLSMCGLSGLQIIHAWIIWFADKHLSTPASAWAGVGFGRVYRRYFQTMPFFGALRSLLVVWLGGLFQWSWWWKEGMLHMCLIFVRYCSRFLFLWSSGEYQSEERYAIGWGVWGGPTVFVCFLAGFCWVMQYRAELTNVAMYILQMCEVVQARLAVAKRWNVTALHSTVLLKIWTSHTAAKLQLKALAESCPHPATAIGSCILQRSSSFIRKGMDYSVLQSIPLCCNVR